MLPPAVLGGAVAQAGEEQTVQRQQSAMAKGNTRHYHLQHG